MFDTKTASLKFLPVGEVAERLRLSRGGVLNLVRRGALPHYRFGIKIFVTERDLEDYVTRARRPALAA